MLVQSLKKHLKSKVQKETFEALLEENWDEFSPLLSQVLVLKKEQRRVYLKKCKLYIKHLENYFNE